METIFYTCAIVGGTIIACQFVLTLFGLGGGGHDMSADHSHGDIGGHDVGGDHAVGGHDGAHDSAHHHADHADNSHWLIGILTFRTITSGIAFFGLVGIIGQRAQLEDGVTIVLALAAGAGAIFLVAWVMRMLGKLNLDGTVRIHRALGSVGTVYVPIPGGESGPGKVHVSVLNRMMEYKAISKSALPTGAKIKVIAIVGADTVEVALEHAEQAVTT